MSELLRISIHMDDLLWGAEDDDDDGVVCLLGSAHDVAVAEYEDDLGLPFAKHKGAHVSSSADLTWKLAGRLGEFGTHGGVSTRRLAVGAQYSGGRRVRPTHLKRVSAFKHRQKLLRELYTLQPNSAKVFVSGIMPSVLFGAETFVAKPSHVRAIRVQGLKSRCMFSPGAVMFWSYAILGDTVDPGLLFCEAALYRYQGVVANGAPIFPPARRPHATAIRQGLSGSGGETGAGQ